MLPSFEKAVLPAHQRSNIVYKYLCHCNSVYVGRMPQRLEERIRQHVPKFIRNKIRPSKDFSRHQSKSIQNAPISYSAIDQHLLDHKICAEKFNIKWFSILATGLLHRASKPSS